MRLADLAATSQQVARERSRLEKIALLAGRLRGLDREDSDIAVAFLTGELRQGRVGLGGAAVRAARGVPSTGERALELRDVDARLAQIASLRGPGSATRKREVLAGLFASATAEEQDFLARLLLGELRQGALEGVLVEAVAGASGIPAVDLRRAAMLGGSLRAVAVAALVGGDLSAFRLEVLRPVQPMLAQSAATPADALERLGRAALEWKLDGARIQVHRAGDDVRVYSRQLNEVTPAVPEVVEAALALPADAFVLDGEAIALGDGGRPRPFQVTMRRFGRKLDVDRLRGELPLSPFFFDLLHLDGDDWIDRPYAERQQRLASLLPPPLRVAAQAVETAEEAEAFFAGALARGHEGVVAKALDAPYEAGRRGAPWIKIKPAKTLDLVVLAAEWGSGRRRGKLSNLHLGARDPERRFGVGEFVLVGKTFKGMTDAVLARQTQRLLQIATEQDRHTVHVRPELLVEIALDGVQQSPHYPGGAALRFARLRGYRDDKAPDEADTIGTVRALGGLDPP
jgi:DNA ligase-1